MICRSRHLSMFLPVSRQRLIQTGHHGATPAGDHSPKSRFPALHRCLRWPSNRQIILPASSIHTQNSSIGGAPRLNPFSVADHCGGRAAVVPLCLRRNPMKRVVLAYSAEAAISGCEGWAPRLRHAAHRLRTTGRTTPFAHSSTASQLWLPA